MARNRLLVSCSFCILHKGELTGPELAMVRSFEWRLRKEEPLTDAEVQRLDALCRRVEHLHWP